MRIELKTGGTLLPFILCCSTVFLVECGPNSGNSKLRELEHLQGQVALFPSFVEQSTHKTSKGTLATVSKLYKSTATYEDVKRYYVRALTEQGWEYSGEKPIEDWGKDLGGHLLLFRRGEYRLTLTHPGEEARYGWDYAVELVWEAKQ